MKGILVRGLLGALMVSGMAGAIGYRIGWDAREHRAAREWAAEWDRFKGGPYFFADNESTLIWAINVAGTMSGKVLLRPGTYMITVPMSGAGSSLPDTSTISIGHLEIKNPGGKRYGVKVLIDTSYTMLDVRNVHFDRPIEKPDPRPKNNPQVRPPPSDSY